MGISIDEPQLVAADDRLLVLLVVAVLGINMPRTQHFREGMGIFKTACLLDANSAAVGILS